MKWILILALMVGCTSGQNKEAKSTSEATESYSKPVSPLTVQPCYCMKIYQPVCAGGQNYGNSCEAECHGHKKWTEGNCAQGPKK